MVGRRFNNFKLTLGGLMKTSEVSLGDVLWAKLGNWPWWPAKVISAHQVEQIDPEEKKPVIVRFFAYKHNDL